MSPTINDFFPATIGSVWCFNILSGEDGTVCIFFIIYLFISSIVVQGFVIRRGYTWKIY